MQIKILASIYLDASARVYIFKHESSLNPLILSNWIIWKFYGSGIFYYILNYLYILNYISI